MGEYISFSQGILVTIVSMIAVFIVLLLIAFLIWCLQSISGDKKEVKVNKSNKSMESVEQLMIVEDTDLITEELVVVIAAAVAANLGMNIPDINIRSIKRIPQMTSTWSNVGNIKQTIGRL